MEYQERGLAVSEEDGATTNNYTCSHTNQQHFGFHQIADNCPAFIFLNEMVHIFFPQLFHTMNQLS